MYTDPLKPSEQQDEEKAPLMGLTRPTGGTWTQQAPFPPGPSKWRPAWWESEADDHRLAGNTVVLWPSCPLAYPGRAETQRGLGTGWEGQNGGHGQTRGART